MRHLIILLAFASAGLAVDPSVGRKLIFSDDFNGDKLDETKWVVNGAADMITFVKAGKQGALRIGLKNQEDMIQNHTISTRGKFGQQFGYFEASMRMHAGDGHTAAFRIMTDDEKTPPSITASFHSTGKERISPYARILLESGSQEFRPDKPVGKFTDLSKKFHTYGILWTEKGFTWFLDGKVVQKLDRKEFVRPMSLYLSHRIEEAERPNLNLKSLPDDVEIDWVKVWK